ncbi:hypothetical protein EVAR_47192_1 [Eumeta japonica]|uniref:Uncharacterized protein n=1 Tax=Eumeta variegata TaxID=151549 RepID=A0A4C1WWZ0_EUMVA|nr:hypothetical protein EVAR_47192_1 [Eumeta japonica]
MSESRLKEDVVTGVEKGILRSFGHLGMINKNRLTKQINKANVCGGRIGKGPRRKSYANQKFDGRQRNPRPRIYNKQRRPDDELSRRAVALAAAVT